MKSLSRLFKYDGYKTTDIQVSTKDRVVKVYLERDEQQLSKCHRCGCFLSRKRGQHRMNVQEHPIQTFKTEIHFFRFKGHCTKCNKARSEEVSFLSRETPHMTEKYSEWLGMMCEFAAVSRVAEFNDLNASTLRNLDFGRLKRLLKTYKIPDITHIAVDEVYVLKFHKNKHKSRSKCFFTIITDLNTSKVIWVSKGRSKESLDQFFQLIGRKACAKIKVVAMDQFEGYQASTEEYCPKATVVWDKFHIMQNFEKVANEVRKDLHDKLDKKDPLVKLTRGKYRFLFLKKANRRDNQEQEHIEQVMKQNGKFFQLEIIKEAMLQFFNYQSVEDAKDALDQITMWIFDAQFFPLMKWIDQLHKGWETLKNYFEHRVTSAVAEGTNNVIKTLKRQAYGYRHLDYFAYKIMQKCGYLNSRFINELEKPGMTS